jgi:hypothetical protein
VSRAGPDRPGALALARTPVHRVDAQSAPFAYSEVRAPREFSNRHTAEIFRTPAAQTRRRIRSFISGSAAVRRESLREAIACNVRAAFVCQALTNPAYRLSSVGPDFVVLIVRIGQFVPTLGLRPSRVAGWGTGAMRAPGSSLARRPYCAVFARIVGTMDLLLAHIRRYIGR